MKKILIILLVIGGIGTGLWFALHFEREATVKSKPLSPEGAAEVVTLLTKDADNDGLKDWEEDLWQADSTKADTDGDGTNDGDEIQAGRNPLIAGPNDPLDAESIREKTTLEQRKKPLNETDRIAREFFKTYIAAKKQGGRLTEESLNILAARVFEDAPAIEKPSFSKNDLIVSPQSDIASIRSYGNTVGTTIGSVPGYVENELTILDKAARSEDPEYLARLDLIIAAYGQLLADLKAIPVPKGAEDEHIALLSNIAGIHQSIEKMRNLFENPILVMPALTLYKESADSLVASLRALDQYFLGQGITFKKGEGGYLLTELGV